MRAFCLGWFGVLLPQLLGLPQAQVLEWSCMLCTHQRLTCRLQRYAMSRSRHWQLCDHTAAVSPSLNAVWLSYLAWSAGIDTMTSWDAEEEHSFAHAPAVSLGG